MTSSSDPIGNLPVAGPITLRQEVHSGIEMYHMLDRFFGGGLTAGELHAELQPVCDGPGKGQLEHIRHVLNSTDSYLGGHVSSELQGIAEDLAAAYQGKASAKMASQFQDAGTKLGTLAPKFSVLAGQVNGTQDILHAAWQSVKGYSRFGSDMSNVESMTPWGGESDDDKANDAWNAAKKGLAHVGGAMANVQGGNTHQFDTTFPSTPVLHNPQANIPNAGSYVPCPGTYSPGPGPGWHGPGPGPGSGWHGPGPGPGWGGPGPGPGYGPGLGGPGYGPGGFGPGGPGGHGGYGPGAGLDTHSDLASAGPGPGYGGPGGFGPGGSGLGGDGSGRLASAAGGAAGGPGPGAVGAGAAGGAGGSGVAAMPMGGRGGAGGGADGEHERSTWLVEDDDVWGGSDAPDGVIS